MTFAGMKIWPLLVAMGAAVTAAGVTVWAAYATSGLTLFDARETSGEPGDANVVLAEVDPAAALGGNAGLGPDAGGQAGGTAAGAASGESAAAMQDCVALRYARALQEGRTDEVIAMTHWMQERLKRVRLGASASDEVAAAREGLRQKILRRTMEDNRLCPEGVEDKYIFAPGAHIEVVGRDKRENARDPLACPVKERIWLRVDYPDSTDVLRDEAGRPIKSIVVGVDVSADGLVVKAGVVGNVEIDRNAVTFE